MSATYDSDGPQSFGDYLRPPRLHRSDGGLRRVGVEVEFSGVEVEEVALLVATRLRGEVRRRDRLVVDVENTVLGNFRIELDSKPLKDRAYLEPLEAVGIDTRSSIAGLVEDSVMAVAREVVPVEVVAPPIEIPRLPELDPLWPELRRLGVQGTRSSVLRAYGLQLNPEVVRLEAVEVLRVLKSYLLLEDWLQRRSDIDLSRRVVPFINPFPEAFRRETLALSDIDFPELVEHYLRHNPTRNRPLDLLPLFAEVDAAFISGDLEGAELVKARPAFHYRLPNCDIERADWSPAEAWNMWVEVERLASDADLLDALSASYLETADLPLRLQAGSWVKEIEARLHLPPA